MSTPSLREVVCGRAVPLGPPARLPLADLLIILGVDAQGCRWCGAAPGAHTPESCELKAAVAALERSRGALESWWTP